MTPERFENLLSIVGPLITKKTCRSRKPISAAERLVITIRYLATGDSQQSQSFNFRVGRTTVCNIIRETCEAIWKSLQEFYLKPPSNESEWKTIAENMHKEWNFPHCLGALDGKHVRIDCPNNGGSEYFNYKGFHSIVLLAMCDGNYTFTLVDIGNFGKDNDASILNNSLIGKGFAENAFKVPDPDMIDGFELPYVILGDDIFALKHYLMKPYGGRNLSETQFVFNYRLSRCRRTIENAFGILSARWRIFRRPIKGKPENVDYIVKACLCLHNYLRLTDNASYIPSGFVDSFDSKGDLIPGDWRTVVNENESGLLSI